MERSDIQEAVLVKEEVFGEFAGSRTLLTVSETKLHIEQFSKLQPEVNRDWWSTGGFSLNLPLMCLMVMGTLFTLGR